jgi:nucleoid-associated protein YgaU
VQEGDSLWRIAKKVYGAGHRWNEIWEANRDVLASEDDVTPGMTLVIP